MDVAVIGTGFIGKQHIEAIRRVPGARLVAVCEPNEAVAKQLSQAMEIPRYYTTVEDMLAQEPNLQVVHNCTPSSFHFAINQQLISAGVNVYCEKPFTSNAEQSAILVQQLAESGLKGGVNFNYRHNLMVEEMRERVADGSIGRPWFVNTEYLQDWLLKQTDYDWRVDAEIGGPTRAIADIGSHCFDTLQYILGQHIVSVEVKRLQEYATRFRNGQEVPVSNEDAAIIFVTFEDGLSGLIRVSQVSAGKKNDLHVLVEGQKQALEWYQERPDRLWIGHRDQGNEELYAASQYLHGQAAADAELPNGHAVGWKDAFTAGIQAFYDDVNGKSSVGYVDFSEADYLMRLVDACVVSDAQQKTIQLQG